MSFKLQRDAQCTDVIWEGDTKSKPVRIEGFVAALAIRLPAAFVGASLSFEEVVMDDAGNVTESWPLHNDGALVSVNISKPALNNLPAELFPCQLIRFVSPSVETLETKLQMVS